MEEWKSSKEVDDPSTRRVSIKLLEEEDEVSEKREGREISFSANADGI